MIPGTSNVALTLPFEVTVAARGCKSNNALSSSSLSIVDAAMDFLIIIFGTAERDFKRIAPGGGAGIG